MDGPFGGKRMQVQKEEMKEDILAAAEYEFIKRGYKSASLRTIAKRANTTIGNLYNYFESKEDILDRILGDIPERIHNVFETHKEVDPALFDIDLNNIAQLCAVIEEHMPTMFSFDLLLCNEVIILLEGCEGTKYEQFRDHVYHVFYSHLSEHFEHIEEKDFIGKELYIHTVVTSIIDAIIYIAKNKRSVEEGSKVLMEYIKMILIGMMSIDAMTFSLEMKK